VTEHENDEIVIQIRSGDLFKSSAKSLGQKIHPVLEHIAATLNDYPEFSVLAIGHTDNIGSPQSNQALSERRAESVRDALVSLGLDENRVSCEGRGDTEPIAPNTSSEGRSVNRRVDLLISPDRFPVSEPSEPAPRAGENGDRPEKP
jgi:outer membrane protein OmpA-like peptidoglycan-associated protein